MLDPEWNGASQDIADIEAESLERQRAAERRETEQEEKKRTAARKAEEEERRKAEAVPKPAKAGTSRGTSRSGSAARGSNASTPSTSHVQIGGGTTKRGASSTRRTTSGIGRGAARGSTRGRG
jgi:hypothetical protein